MKKNGIWIILLFVISVAVFGTYMCYDNIFKDITPPSVTCDSEFIIVSVKADDKDLLEGVYAIDDKSGDVSDSLVIEKISALVDGERIITYAAVDKKGNVGRAQRVLKYSDYEAPTLELTDSLVFPTNSNVNLLKYITAASTLDGDLTSNVKYSIDGFVDYSVEGVYEVEFRVSDSAGTVSYLTANLEIYKP